MDAASGQAKAGEAETQHPEGSYPVSEGHALIVQKKVLASMYDLPKAWQNELWSASGEVRSILSDWYSPDAFNIGINDGLASGQTVMHTHIHVIPRTPATNPILGAASAVSFQTKRTIGIALRRFKKGRGLEILTPVFNVASQPIQQLKGFWLVKAECFLW